MFLHFLEHICKTSIFFFLPKAERGLFLTICDVETGVSRAGRGESDLTTRSVTTSNVFPE